MLTPRFILASASPARRRLLQSVGIEPVVQPSHFDESQVQLSDPAELVQTLALRKAETIAAQMQPSNLPTLVMGCDSVLAIKGEIHGKPANPEEAIARWQLMRGQVGELYTGHALIRISSDSSDQGADARSQKSENTALVRCQLTQVYFAWVSDRQIQSYVATDEPLNCAGCFALEGKGGLFVEKLQGCHSNVIGLSLPLLRQMLDALGFDVTDFWRSEL
ncbi:nucleoside triphosphate pyrophosphatase [Leptothermofonsia sp. ETS-13]|uniref:nucleoside triphosphate pyrophosphatase n=1 Tax=Leptothermofonsia sp. ETS-13 TaxID=3035696 RepID=UPI003B9F94F0